MNNDHNKLKSLFDLLDDDNEEVINEVRKAFDKYGLMLENDLAELKISIDNPKLKIIEDIIKRNRRTWLKIQWVKVWEINDEYLLLERALELLTKFDYGITYNPNFSERINQISLKFLKENNGGTVFDLINFLFISEGYEGNKEDYYNPLNSNLDYLLTYKKGLPITLTILFMLVANKLGFKVEGCRFPGHFLAKVFINDNVFLVDCFNRGKIISERELKSLAAESYESFLTIINEKTTVKMILIRILSNLYKAYELKGDLTNQNFFEELAMSI